MFYKKNISIVLIVGAFHYSLQVPLQINQQVEHSIFYIVII